MNVLLALGIHNTVVSLLLGLCVYGLTRVWRHPPVAHILWLLVLLKLVFPPLAPIELSALQAFRLTHPRIAAVQRIDSPSVETNAHVVELAMLPSAVPMRSSRQNERHFVDVARPFWDRVAPILAWLWLGGAAMAGLIAVRRIVRFERLVQDTLPASRRLQRLANQVAEKIGLRTVPRVRYVECVDVPFLWCVGRRATIVLPVRISQLDDEQLYLILAHELAHFGRRDHWVRALELAVSALYWWNPLVWFVRRQIHEAEDLCCDAWVRSLFPDHTKRYAELLLATAESLGASRIGARPLPATPFLRSLSLKARIEMILKNRCAPHLSRKSIVALALIALLVLPLFVAASTQPAQAQTKDESRTTSEFPCAVRFEQGTIRFLDGDQITLIEVRGTAETFSPGNLYWIKGKYTLASHERAMLYADITAADAKDSSRAPLRVQATTVNRGDGTFTLFLPMTCRGWPHVSFYPADGGEGFGGNYFGTGDSVFKPSRESNRAPTSLSQRFKFQVPFELGRTQTQDGGRIEIREVLGTRPQIEIGGQYLVRGKYVLPPGEHGKLYFYASAGGAWGQTASLDLQSISLDQTEGEFELIHGMAGPGYFHLILNDAERYSRWFADVYFGTGDNVLH